MAKDVNEEFGAKIQEGFPSCTLLTRSLIADVDRLISGAHIDIRNYTNLCTFVDAVVLNHGCLIFGSGGTALTELPFYQFILKHGIARELMDYLGDKKKVTIPGFAMQAALIDFATQGGIPQGHEHRDDTLSAYLAALHVFTQGRKQWMPDVNSEGGFSKDVPFTSFREWLHAQGWDDEQPIANVLGILNSVHRWLSAVENVRSITGLSVTDDSFVACLAPHFAKTSYRSDDRLYEVLSRVHRAEIQDLQQHSGMKSVYAPPLMSILLSRCNDRGDIPVQTLKLREEFSQLREAELGWAKKICTTQLPLRERLEAMREMDEAVARVSRSFKGPRPRKYVFRSWDLVKSGNPVKIGAEMLDRMIKHSEDYQVRHRVQPYLDLVNAALEVADFENLVRRTFGEEMDANAVREYMAVRPSEAELDNTEETTS